MKLNREAVLLTAYFFWLFVVTICDASAFGGDSTDVWSSLAGQSTGARYRSRVEVLGQRILPDHNDLADLIGDSGQQPPRILYRRTLRPVYRLYDYATHQALGVVQDYNGRLIKVADLDDNGEFKKF